MQMSHSGWRNVGVTAASYGKNGIMHFVCRSRDNAWKK